MTYLYAKGDGERLSVHIQKVVHAVRQLRDSIPPAHPILNDEFWAYLEYAAIIHDFGKASENFQDYIKWIINGENPKEKVDVGDLVPHSSLSPVFCNWFEWDMAEEWRRNILSAVYFHHDRSKLYNYISEGKIEKVSEGELERLREEFTGMGDEYLNRIARSIGTLNYRFLGLLISPRNVVLRDMFREESEKDINKQRRYIFFKGFLHRADHYASSLDGGDKNGSSIEIRPLDVAVIEGNITREILKGKGGAENLWQFQELKQRENRGRNTILVGSTGIGKTEFAFLWGVGRKLFFTLPMRTMTDEIFRRARVVFNEQAGLLHSSAITTWPEVLGKNREIEVSDIELNMNLSKNLSYPVIVCTGDQVLNVSLKYPTYEKIMAALGYSNLVIDEIQAYSPETSAVIVKTIEDVVEMGGNFLLMTATLPDYIKDEIAKRLPEEEQAAVFSIYSKTGSQDIQKHRIHFVDMGESTGKEEKAEKSTLEIKIEPFYYKVKSIILENPGKKVLITINTVKNAQLFFERLLKDEALLETLSINKENLLLLHSRFTGRHRQNKISRVTGRLHETKENLPEVKFLVTTQIIEASVDIDFDILISELAPLDSLVQRMGRVNRNRGEYKTGKGDVFVIGGYLKDSKWVYNDTTLDLTARMLSSLRRDEEIISEKEKEEVLKKYYNHKDYSKIKRQFQRNLEILDNYILASSKSEAQEIFRKVNSVTIIPFEEIDCFFKRLSEVWADVYKPSENDEKVLRQKFKVKLSELLIAYSTSVRFNVFHRIHHVELGAYLFDKADIPGLKKKSELKRFLKGYFVTLYDSRWQYDEVMGLKECS